MGLLSNDQRICAQSAFMTYLHIFQDNDPKSTYLLPTTLHLAFKQDWENFINILGLVEPLIKLYNFLSQCCILFSSMNRASKHS